MMKIAPIEKKSFRGVEFYLLRDDLIGKINGNKARKLAYFLNSNLDNYDKIVSYGSSQSNAMYALSLFAKENSLEFLYVVSHLNKTLKTDPIGNLKFSLENGMKLFVAQNRELFARSLVDSKTLFIKEGVAQSEAAFGFEKQASEIELHARNLNLCFDIFLPSGTGASAAYLSKFTKFKVFTTPCVGDEEYLKKEILSLDKNSAVTILPPPKKYHFAKPCTELYSLYKELLKECRVEFELIYDMVGFLTLLKHKDRFKNPILYIHQGGILGNISQIERYRYKFKEQI